MTVSGTVAQDKWQVVLFIVLLCLVVIANKIVWRFVIPGLRTGEINFKGYRLNKADQPLKFWIVVIICIGGFYLFPLVPLLAAYFSS